jgi:hypothetical protein
MNIDAVNSSAEAMGNLLKMMVSETIDTSEKFVRATAQAKLAQTAAPLGDYQGATIDTYA